MAPRVCRGSLTCLEATQWVDRDLPSRHQETALHTNSKMGRGTSPVTPCAETARANRKGLAVWDRAGGRIGIHRRVWFPIKTGLTIMTFINRSDLAPPVSYPQLPHYLPRPDPGSG